MKRSRPRRTLEQVKLYQAALDAALAVGKLFQHHPAHEEQTGLTTDVLRATRKVCAGIAAGWTVRQNIELSLAHLEEAQGHAAEAMVLLEIAHRLGYLKANQVQPQVQTYQQFIQRISQLAESRQELGFMGGGCGEGGCGHCHDEEE